MYIATAGRFNIDAYIGWQIFDRMIDKNKLLKIPELSHSQVQSFLGMIGFYKGYDVWVPQYDRSKIKNEYLANFSFREALPERFSKVTKIIQEIDVIWLKRGSSDLTALFEVEHSTPVYSGLLRFNDLHIVEPKLNTKFNIVSNEIRRSLFIRQISRPTFKASGLNGICNFLDYSDVYIWHNNIKRE